MAIPARCERCQARLHRTWEGDRFLWRCPSLCRDSDKEDKTGELQRAFRAFRRKQ